MFFIPGEAVRLGPFNGGLNLFSDESSIEDNELQACTNLEVDLDGSLVSRPPIRELTGLTGNTWTGAFIISSIATFADVNYIIGYAYSTQGTWVINTSTGVCTQLSATFNVGASVQYAGVVWMIHYNTAGTVSAAHWDPTGGYVAISGVDMADLNTMMGGSRGSTYMVVYKERLWICSGPSLATNSSRLIFSEPSPTTWNAGANGVFQTTNFIDISPGDGQTLNGLVVYQDTLLLFKTNSTYTFSYSTTPATGQVLKINSYIGTGFSDQIVSYENSVFIFHQNEIYEIVDFNFTQLNIKVPFEIDHSVPGGTLRVRHASLSRFGDRLVVRVFNRTYVYGLRTKTWSLWQSANNKANSIGPLFSHIQVVGFTPQYVLDKYYAGSSADPITEIFVIQDGYQSAVFETIDGADVDITCSFTTKQYDLGSAHQYKRLYSWGVDLHTNNDVIGTISPYTVNPSSSTTATTAATTGGTVRKQFVRFPKAVRFRQIKFTVQTATDGSSNVDNKVRIFSISMHAKTKQVGPKEKI